METAPQPIHELEAQRRANRDAAAALGFLPYGERVDGLMTLAGARCRYDEAADRAHQEAAKAPPPGFVDARPTVKVAGRVMLLRDNGKLLWLNLRDDTGDLQTAISQKDADEASFGLAKTLDLGDVIVVEGRLMRTRTGEITAWASRVSMGAKCLEQPPEKHAGLTDPELRYRRRYVDLHANPETMRAFHRRSALVRRARRWLDERGYLEVETPMLQVQAGGAAARPFKTHMNALDMTLYMRIAPELYLKRLLVGGMRRVYEINRNFRNEGLDRNHNPEFTMLEAYEAFGDVHTMMALTEGLIRELAREIAEEEEQNPLRRPRFTGGDHFGKTLGEVFDNHRYYFDHIYTLQDQFFQSLPDEIWRVLRHLKDKNDAPNFVLMNRQEHKGPIPLKIPFGDLAIDYGSPFVRAEYGDLFQRALGFPMTDAARARAEAKARGLKHEGLDHWLIVNELFEEVAEPTVDPSRPTFITGYPSAISPLTRPRPGDPTLADRADLFIGGMEIAPHYTELNDPDVQAAKFREQLAGLDEEENTFRTFDEDFILALKVGMPPAGGMGLGVDRLMMLLTNQRTIRDAVLFPLMRPVE